MTDNQQLEFFKQYIKERLEKIKGDIPARRYKLLLAVIDDCDDYNELREMAELDMQIDLFAYTKTEISPKLQQLNLEMNELREAKSTYPVQESAATDSSKALEYTTEEMLEDMDDPEIDAYMAAIMAARVASMPFEEEHRDDLLNGWDGKEPSLDDLDTLGDEMDEFSDIGEVSSLSEEDFGDLDELGLDNEDEITEDEKLKLERQAKAKADTADLIEDDDPFDDFDLVEKKKSTDGLDLLDDEDSLGNFFDQSEQEGQSLDDLDLSSMTDDEDEDDGPGFIEDGDFEEAFGDMLNEISAKNPLFEETGEEDPEDLELSEILGLDREDLIADEDEDDEDNLDNLDDLISDAFGSDDADDDDLGPGLDDDLSKAFGNFEDDDDDFEDNFRKNGLGPDMEFDPADFGDFPDADDLFGGDSSKNNMPIEGDEQDDDPFKSLAGIDDDLGDSFGSFDNDEDDEGEKDAFGSLNDDDFGELDGDDDEADEDELSSIDNELFGIEDDSDDFFSSQQSSNNSNDQSRKAPEKKINTSTIFANGSKHGNETQKMFDTILKVGSLFGKAQSTITKQAKRGVQSGARTLQRSGMFSLSSNT